MKIHTSRHISALTIGLALCLSPHLPAQTEAQTTKASAAMDQIRKSCHVPDPNTETNPKQINKQLDCVWRAIAAQKRKIATEKALQTTLNQAFGITPTKTIATVVTKTGTEAAAENAGGSSTDTPSTCGKGMGTTNNSPLIRVHRLLMAPKNASDDFGYRLGRRYIVYQVTISNDSKDYQYLIHDVSFDLSPLFYADPGTYRFAASSQELSLLRGIPEKGQDLDRRNLLYHVLQGVGSVAGGISGLTTFSDVMGSSVAVFNGPFLQSFVGIAPDHTGTQLNRLSDSAYITNTLVDKQRAKTIAIFIPEATILSKAQQRQYWNEPYQFLQTVQLNQADVCVDGSFVETVAPAPTLTSAVLAPKTAGGTLAAGSQAILTLQGNNLAAGDTLVFGFGTPLTVSNATSTTGTVEVTIPAGYDAKTAPVQVHVASSANPSVTSGVVTTTEQQ